MVACVSLLFSCICFPDSGCVLTIEAAPEVASERRSAASCPFMWLRLDGKWLHFTTAKNNEEVQFNIIFNNFLQCWKPPGPKTSATCVSNQNKNTFSYPRFEKHHELHLQLQIWETVEEKCSSNIEMCVEITGQQNETFVFCSCFSSETEFECVLNNWGCCPCVLKAYSLVIPYTKCIFRLLVITGKTFVL